MKFKKAIQLSLGFLSTVPLMSLFLNSLPVNTIPLLTILPAQAQQTWTQISGSAKDIGVGANGDIWIIGSTEILSEQRDFVNYPIYRWKDGNWETVDGHAVRIDVDGNGNPWVVNAQGDIYRRENDKWVQLPGSAKDIGVGANGKVWVVGTAKTGANNSCCGVYEWTGSNWKLFDAPEGAAKIDVDKDGNPWVTTTDENIFRLRREDGQDDKWVTLDGSAKDIGVGSDGTVWIVGTIADVNARQNSDIYQYQPGLRKWLKVDGSARAISVSNKGWPFIVKADGSIYVREAN